LHDSFYDPRVVRELRVDDDVRRLALGGQVLRAVQLHRERTGASFSEAVAAVHAQLPTGHGLRTGGRASTVVAVLAIVTGAVMVIGLLYVLVAGLDRASELIGRHIVGPNLAFLLRAEVVTVFGLLVLFCGFPFAKRFRHPGRWRAGVIAVAVAFLTSWPLQYIASRLHVAPELTMYVHGAAFFVTICILSGGLESMRRASNTPEADSWEFLDSGLR
jgi:hypothetical protein